MNRPSLGFLQRLKTRERVLLAACLAVFAYLVFELSVLRPQRLEQKSLRGQITRAHADADMLSKVVQQTAPNSGHEPTAGLRAERDQMMQTIARAEGLLGEVTGDARGWQGVRATAGPASGVKLISLRTLTSEAVIASAAAAALTSAPPSRAASASAGAPKAGAPFQLYRSGVELTLEGSYPALTGFMAAVEQSSPHLLWGDVTLQAGQYPTSVLKMTLYSLSSRPAGLLE